MRLEGSLDAFSLPDIFQLLSYTKKTGGLHLHRDGQRGLVHVRDGAVSAASADLSRHGLVRRLVGTGRVDEAGLERAASAAQAGESLVRALLDSGAVEEDEVRDAAREQVLDAVFDLLRWPDGDFSFVVDEPDPDGLALALPVDDVVAEARRRLSGWEAMLGSAPAPGVVLALPVLPAAEPAVSREEWAVLALVDGRRTLADVVALSGLGEHGVLQLVMALMQRGLLVDGTTDDSVGALLRRQALLQRLEGAPTPAAGAAPDATRAEESSPQPAPAAPPPPRDEPAPVHAVPDLPADDGARVAAALAGAAPAPRPAPARPAEPVAARLEAAIPARPEPFNPRRRPEHPEDVPAPIAAVVGSAAVATDPLTSHATLIERDPSVNKSLLLRLIAGVRGL